MGLGLHRPVQSLLHWLRAHLPETPPLIGFDTYDGQPAARAGKRPKIRRNADDDDDSDRILDYLWPDLGPW
jgi:hypothetical protein